VFHKNSLLLYQISWRAATGFNAGLADRHYNGGVVGGCPRRITQKDDTSTDLFGTFSATIRSLAIPQAVKRRNKGG